MVELKTWSIDPTEGPDPGAVEQMRTCMADERVVGAALMADHHKGYSMPIGGVIAYENAISPSGVGFDIGCGNLALRTPLKTPIDVPRAMAEINRRIAFGIGRNADFEANTQGVFDQEDVLWDIVDDYCQPGLKDLARKQLGTVGSGNHYVDLLADESGFVWIANHFGSRGFGHKVATAFLNRATGDPPDAKLKEKEEATVFGLDSDIGVAYHLCMKLASMYAVVGRDAVATQVLQILGVSPDDVTARVSSNHNTSNYEIHGGKGVHVVRKGATGIRLGEAAYIGGSMGDGAVIVSSSCEGEEYEDSLSSGPHGAGRVMSRTKAAGKFIRVKNAEGKKIRVRDAATGFFNYQDEIDKLAQHGITVIGGGADEVPGVYKNLEHVIETHSYIKVEVKLHTLGVVMATPETYDPYKD